MAEMFGRFYEFRGILELTLMRVFLCAELDEGYATRYRRNGE